MFSTCGVDVVGWCGCEWVCGGEMMPQGALSGGGGDIDHWSQTSTPPTRTDNGSTAPSNRQHRPNTVARRPSYLLTGELVEANTQSEMKHASELTYVTVFYSPANDRKKQQSNSIKK